MKRIYIILSFLSLLIATNVVAQDAMFSQVCYNKMTLNPAYTGNQLGVMGLVAHRSQWTAIPSTFNTSNLQMAAALPKLNAGVGGMITHNVEGSGKLRSFSLDLSGSKVVPLISQTNSKMFLYLGLGASINQKSINWDNLVFADQLDQVNGINGETSAAQVPSNTNHLFPDFNTGFALKGINKEVFYNVGMSVDHILEPNESVFQTSSGKLPKKYVFDAFMGMPLNKAFKSVKSSHFWIPGFVLQHQANFQTALLGSNFTQKHFAVGAWYKSRLINFAPSKSDALVLNAAMFGDFSKEYHYTLSYSYDATVSRLVTNTAGSHEITLIINYYSKQKYQSAKYSNCAKLEGPSELEMPFIW